MPSWKRVITSGSDAQLNSLNLTNGATGSFTGSFIGDGSQLTGISFPPGGSDSQIQYNNGGTTSGATNFVYDDVNQRVGIGTTSPSEKLSIVGKININDGGNSVFVGDGAGLNDDASDNRNVGVGYDALENNTTGFYNTATGYQALLNNTTGFYNTATGYQALLNNTTGIRNTASGFLALRDNTTGDLNTANGYQALFYNTTGFNNTATGYLALRNNTTGVRNTASGVYAGRFIANGNANQTGNNSVFLGYNTRANADGETNQIVIGYDAIGLGSNTVVLGNSSITKTALRGNVGIGNTSPASKLEVSGNVAIGYGNVAPTNGMIVSGNVGIGTTSPDAKLHIEGGDVLSNLSVNDTYFIAGPVAGLNLAIDDNEIQVRNNGSADDLLLQKNGGNIGINTATPSETLHVAGKARITTIDNGTGDFTTISGTGVLTRRTAAQVLSDIGAQAALTNPITGTGSSGQVSFFNGTTTQTGDNGLFWDNSNKRLGIGTTSPSNKLEVVGQSSTNQTLGLFTASNSNNTVAVSRTTNSPSYIALRAQANIAYIDAGPSFGINTTTSAGDSPTQRMRIDSNGNVGIGTTSPSSKLEVSGNVAIGYGNVAPTNGMIVAGNVGIGTATPDARVHSRDTDTGGSTLFRADGYYGGLDISASNNYTKANTILGSFNRQQPGYQNLGIKTTSGEPDFIFKTNGDFTVEGGNISANKLSLGNAGLTSYHSAQLPETQLFTVGGSNMVGDYSRAVSLWSTRGTSPWQSWVGTNLRYDGTNYRKASDLSNQNWGNISGIRFLGGSSDANRAIDFITSSPNQTSGTDNIIGTNIDSLVRMTITNGGDVGIGNTTPASKLEVSGNVAIGYTNAAPTNGMIVAGNVGIGTNNPTSILDITSGTNDLGPRIIHDSATNSGDGGNLFTQDSEIKSLRFHYEPGNYTFAKITTLNYNTGGTGWFTFSNRYSSGLGFSTSNGGVLNEALRIDPEGNVGIGTTSPSEKLSIVGKININDGGNSVFVGEGAGVNDDASDNRNVGVGYDALENNTTGRQNTATGFYALRNNTTGDFNTATGYYALLNNTTGYRNTASGYQALRDNTTGYQNTASGYRALYSNTTGQRNTASGYLALYNNTTGDFNTASGMYAGLFIANGNPNQTGNDSVFLGYDTRANADGETNQIVIGYDAIGLGSNTVVLGNSSITKTALRGNVGIGTTSPSEKLDVNGNIKLNNSLLSNQQNTDVDTGTETVATVSSSTYDGAFFDYVIKNGTNLRAGTVIAVHDGTNVSFTETSTQDLGNTTDLELSVDLSGGSLRLLATASSNNWSIKTIIRAL